MARLDAFAKAPDKDKKLEAWAKLTKDELRSVLIQIAVYCGIPVGVDCFRHVGVVSYGVYLVNVSVIALTKRLLGPSATASAVFVVALPLSVLVATATHRWVERPFLLVRDRMRPLA